MRYRTTIGFYASTILAIGFALHSSPALASRAYDLDIPAQTLADSLRVLGKTTDTNILIDRRVIKDRQAPALKARMTAEEAIARLVLGTDLTVKRIDERTIALVSANSAMTSLLRGEVSTSTHTPATQVAAGEENSMRIAQAETPETSSKGEPAPKGADEDKKESSISEIIVTAQKRKERLQEVPISISVLNGQALDSSTVEGVTEALNRVPGVATTLSSQGGGTQISVRGVTAGGPVAAGSSSVSYYLDSVPFGFVRSAVAPDSSAYDLARVEVLRGPQGTLYGASTLNGVVRVLTHDADLDDFDIKARTSVSTTEDGGQNNRCDLAVNAPIVPGKLAARVVLGYQDLSGWIDRPNNDDANDAQISNVRLKLNAQPTDNLSVGLSAWLSRADYGAPPISINGETSTALLDESMATDYDAFGLQIGYDFPGLSLTSMTGYLDYSNDSALDLRELSPFLVGSRLATSLATAVFSQEVVLNSTADGQWRWSLGAMYRDVEDDIYNFRREYVAPNAFSDASKSYAIFGEVTRVFLGGKFQVTAGLRHFEDEVSYRERSRLDGPPPQLVNTEYQFDALSPRFVLTWHPSDDATLYTTYSEGFRSGFSQGAGVIARAPQIPPAAEDTLRNYEVGAKGVTWGGRLTFDAALYFSDWQDVKQTITVNVAAPGAAPINLLTVVNGESASGIGLEFGLGFEPVEGLELGVNMGWNDLTMDADVTTLSAGVLVPLFAKGDRPVLSPEYTAGASAEYLFPLGNNGLEGRFSAAANYISEQDVRGVTGTTARIVTGDSMLIGRTSFAIESPKHWTASLFIDNVTNEDGITVNSTTTPHWAVRGRPRTAGLQLEYRFK